MKKRNGKFNQKRRMLKLGELNHHQLAVLVSQVQYGGNPEHKRNPDDFKLTPPSSPRSAKSLCDSVKIFTRKEALELLKKGLEKGLVSDRSVGLWPKNIWSVADDGTPLEAQLESSENGTYHGYPMQREDPFYEEVMEQWRSRSEFTRS